MQETSSTSFGEGDKGGEVNKNIKGDGKFKRGCAPLHKIFPLMIGIHIHIMERGIQGVRLIDNLMLNNSLFVIYCRA